MTIIGTNSSGSVNFTDNNILPKTKNPSEKSSLSASSVYSKDTSFYTKKAVVSENPFSNSLEEALKKARENNDSKALFDIAVIQYKQNTIPNVKASDIFREAYETALSEMDSDTLYEIGNFEASHILLPDVSSEFIFKMADMTRKIY